MPCVPTDTLGEHGLTLPELREENIFQMGTDSGGEDRDGLENAGIAVIPVEEITAAGREESQEKVQQAASTASPGGNVVNRAPLQTSSPLRRLRKWDTMQLVELGSSRLHNENLHGREPDSIAEEPEKVSLGLCVQTVVDSAV